MKPVAWRQTTATTSAIAILAVAALAQTAPPANQKFPSRAEEVKAKQEEVAKKERETPATPPKVAASDAEARTIAETASHFEKAYRERAARIDRLLAIYEKKGDRAKVVELQAMRDQLEDRHANAMQGFRKQLGEERWTKVEKHFGGPSARALEVRNERANENAAERDVRKAHKEAEGKVEKPENPPQKKKDEERPKEKPPGRSGQGR